MTLDLNEQQVGYLMNTLAQRPYGEVCDLIAHIHRQAAAQVQQPSQPVRSVNGSGQVVEMRDELCR